MTLIRNLLESPSELRVSSRFTILNGVLYMGAGALLLIWPGAVQALLREREFVGDESALIRAIGMSVIVIGWLYFFGGRSGGRQVVAASVLDRIVLVPLVLLPLAVVYGVFPRLLLSLAILDPVLAVVAWYLLVRESHAAD